MFNVFTILVSEGSSNGEVVHLLETINFKLLDIEMQLEGGAARYSEEEVYV